MVDWDLGRDAEGDALGVAAERVKWDMARRVGRSQQVTLTCDSWRNQAGTLWAPNSLAVVNLPALKLANLTWLISAVTFSRSETGTTAEVTVMTKEAFVPAYEVLQAFRLAGGTGPEWALERRACCAVTASRARRETKSGPPHSGSGVTNPESPRPASSSGAAGNQKNQYAGFSVAEAERLVKAGVARSAY